MNCIHSISALLLSSVLAYHGVAQTNGLISQEINSNWQFKQARGYNWYPATVPGVVHTDLMDNGIIDDPFYRLNERSIQWIDKEDWIYKTELKVDEELLRKSNIELDFKGLDTYADIYLNDSCILKANNMFREWKVAVKHLLKESGNELKVYLHSPIKTDLPRFELIPYPVDAGNDQSENGGIFDKKLSVIARKAGYHYGWDWGPRIVTSGIWRPVYIVGWDNAKIENVQYIQRKVSDKQADLTAKATVFAEKEGEVTLNVATIGEKHSWNRTAHVSVGQNVIDIDFSIKKPKLWWTNGLGEAFLYPFTATISMNGEEADTHSANIGLRSLRVVRDKDANGCSFYFELNGVKLFAKGANYIPQDNFLPRVTHEKYEKTVLDAKNVNMNMLRVWGGGIYENDVFYDLCDKNGILVWQDFMFACSTYPLDSEIEKNIRQEAIENIIRLRNHPCIAIWCGSNETHTAWFNWGWMPRYKKAGTYDAMWKDHQRLFQELLPEIVQKYDESTFYWPSSPYGGDPEAKCESGEDNWNPNGDGHYWGVWQGIDPIERFNKVRSRFFSEYGFQSFPDYRSVMKYAPEERDHDIYSDVMMAHQRGGSVANERIETIINRYYHKPKDFKSFLYTSILLQGDAIKTAMEAHRRMMPYNMGSLFWQHNDCWPVASWSSRDYYGNWKAQHYFARNAFNDILVSPIEDSVTGRLDVYVVSDRLKTTKGTLVVKSMDWNGNVVMEKKMPVVIPGNTSKIQYSVPVETLLFGKKRNEVFIHAIFKESGENGKEISNNYFMCKFKDIDFPENHLELKVEKVPGGYSVTVASPVFARAVFLSAGDEEISFSDNYFDILPNGSVTVYAETSLSLAVFEKKLQAVSLIDAYQKEE